MRDTRHRLPHLHLPRHPHLSAALAALAALLLALLTPATSAHAAPTGFRVENGRLLEARGTTS